MFTSWLFTPFYQCEQRNSLHISEYTWVSPVAQMVLARTVSGNLRTNQDWCQHTLRWGRCQACGGSHCHCLLAHVPALSQPMCPLPICLALNHPQSPPHALLNVTGKGSGGGGIFGRNSSDTSQSHATQVKVVWEGKQEGQLGRWWVERGMPV